MPGGQGLPGCAWALKAAGTLTQVSRASLVSAIWVSIWRLCHRPTLTQETFHFLASMGTTVVHLIQYELFEDVMSYYTQSTWGRGQNQALKKLSLLHISLTGPPQLRFWCSYDIKSWLLVPYLFWRQHGISNMVRFLALFLPRYLKPPESKFHDCENIPIH